jgi:hypothetical protein
MSLSKREVFGLVVRTRECVNHQEIIIRRLILQWWMQLFFIISLVMKEGIDMRLMDVMTAYLYGSLDTEI